MIRATCGTLHRHIEQLFGTGTLTGLGDSDLLARFAEHGDESAFEALSARHGPMVQGVCRRMLGDDDSADDAFQAVFLILAKKAGSIHDGERLGPWLHGVARRVAARARARAARRRKVEQPGHPEPAVTDHDTGRLEQAELRAILDQEIDRLPGRFRAPFVLCYLEGLTHDETALRLGVPVGTVRSRLAWSRDRLRVRLTRRGLAAPAGLAAAIAGPDAASAGSAASLAPAVSPTLSVSTLQAAVAFAAGPVRSGRAFAASELAKGALRAMFLHKLKLGALATLLVAAGATALGLRGGALARPQTPPDSQPRPVAASSTSLDPRGVRADSLAPRRIQQPGLPSAITLSTSRLVVVQPKASRRVLAYSAETGVWNRYDLPAGLVATPIATDDVLALGLEGETVEEVAAYDATSGSWHPQQLKVPVRGPVIPAIGHGVAVYSLGRHVYAYSGEAHRWDVLDLGDTAGAQPVITSAIVCVEHGGKLHTFSSKKGQWTSIDTSPSD